MCDTKFRDRYKSHHNTILPYLAAKFCRGRKPGTNRQRPRNPSEINALTLRQVDAAEGLDAAETFVLVLPTLDRTTCLSGLGDYQCLTATTAVASYVQYVKRSNMPCPQGQGLVLGYRHVLGHRHLRRSAILTVDGIQPDLLIRLRSKGYIIMSVI